MLDRREHASRYRCCVVLLVACACSTEPPTVVPRVKSCGAVECEADPVPHCTARDGCVDSSQCPSGTSCQAVSTSCSDGSSGCKSCAVSNTRSQNTTALLDGFKVKAFRSDPSSTAQ